LNKSISESNLRNKDITILSTEREGQAISNPSGDIKILLKDKLIYFSKLVNLRNRPYVIPKTND
jgi:Trk K+ transport system NAD-binding subunit